MTIQYKPKTASRGIEWADETRNATGGCMHDCRWQMPDGTVAACYAMELAERGVAKRAYPHGFEHHYWRPAMLKELIKGDEPLLIFCDSMSDLFASGVPAEQVRAILDAMRQAPHHTYMSLTKAAPQLLKYVDDLPPNLWVGVSSPPDWFAGRRLSQAKQIAMMRRALQVLASVRERTGDITWMSIEPLSWDITPVLEANAALDWAVIGAASSGRRYYQPDAALVERVLQVLDQAGTPVFFKGNIRPTFDQHDFGSPRLNRWREDFPRRYRYGQLIPAVERRQQQCRQNGWQLSE